VVLKRSGWYQLVEQDKTSAAGDAIRLPQTSNPYLVSCACGRMNNAA
jgi:hypothetical protein